MKSSVFFEVFALGQAVGRLLDHAMAAGPLSPEDYAIYSAIFEAEQISPSAMAARLAMPLTTVMDHVSRLERRDHARRFPNPRDRRASLVVLTADGLAAHRGANLQFERAYAAFVRSLTLAESEAIDKLAAVREAVELAEPVSDPREALHERRP